MHNEVNQKMSMFIDDELSYEEAQAFLKRIKTDTSLKAKMARYQTVSHALKAEEYQQLRPDFLDKISQQIQQEPTYLLPKQSIHQPRKKLFALAASTIAAAVLVGEAVKNYQGSTLDSNALSTSSSSELSTPKSPIMLAQNPKQKVTDRQPMTEEFNDYLQAHNGSVYMNGGVGLQPYAKVAAYGQK